MFWTKICFDWKKNKVRSDKDSRISKISLISYLMVSQQIQIGLKWKTYSESYSFTISLFIFNNI